MSILRLDRAGGGFHRMENLGHGLALRVQSALAAGVASTRVREGMHRVAAEALASAALAAIDASSPRRARAYLDKAMTLASLSRDVETAFRIWDHLMLTSSQRENHGEAAAGADVMKRSTAARRNPLYASLGHMRNANALARLRLRTDALRALGMAERSFDRADEAHAGWIGFYSRAEFDALSSYMWTALGDHHRAEFYLHRTLAALPEQLVRGRALYTAHLALAQARQGDVELACATGAKAYALLPIGSQRTSNTLARTREVVLASGSKAPEATEWIEVCGRWS